uniref:WLM domain-containing protein n=1 Tax=Manihot esculenta TaxID=3983 RepID=A0A2C9UV03_MANES
MQNPESVVNVTVIWRGSKYIVETNTNASLKDLGDELLKLTNVKPDTMRLIVPQIYSKSSKLLSPFSKEHSQLSLHEASIIGERSIRMMGVSEDEVDKVLQNAKIDHRIAGFDEEEKRMRQRSSDRTQPLLKLPQGPCTFNDFRTLEIPGLQLNPPASEALKRMHMLAADPGIIAIMNKHRWRVGIMTELAPVGYVGVSPKCILGFNKNHGEEISLRLRTDDLKGFRKYESIKKTLLHELAHMVYSEHDANFYALDKQLNQEAASLDWTKSTGHTLNGFRHLNHYEEEFYVPDNRSFSQKLGGNVSDQLDGARSSSVAAAYRRLANASANSLEDYGKYKEPDPDDSSFSINDRSDIIDHGREENMDIENPHKVHLEPDYEPDPDEHSGDQSMYEPYPDDSQSNHPLLMETLRSGIQLSKIIDEPDPDDSETKQRNSGYRNIQGPYQNNGLAREENIDIETPHKVQLKLDYEPDSDEHSSEQIKYEPDPDDSQSNHPQLMKTLNGGIQLSKTIDEPDPDDSKTKQSNSGERNTQGPDQNISLVSESMEYTSLDKDYREPDPDESPANITLRTEPDPDDDLVASQEISRKKTAESMIIDEPDPDDLEAKQSSSRDVNIHEPYQNNPLSTEMTEPDPDESQAKRTEPDPDSDLVTSQEISSMKIDEPDPDDELKRIQDPVTVVCGKLRKAVESLRAEVNSTEATIVLQILFKIIRNVIEHPNEMKFKRLRKANPIIQKNVANHKAAIEILQIVGFIEDVVLSETGKTETCLVLKRNDPGLLWLAKSSLEECVTC